MRLPRMLPLLALMLLGAAPPQPADQPTAGANAEPPLIFQRTPRVRPDCPVRLGGVFTMGLGDQSAAYENSAALKVKLGSERAKWIADHCDVAALNAVNITPDTFPAMRMRQALFTPLLYAYASTLYEQPEHAGSIGGWNQRMIADTLRDTDGHEVRYPEAGGHWMDFASADWAAHWRDQALGLVRKFKAEGMVAAELPVDNAYVEGRLAKYRAPSDRITATAAWIAAVSPMHRFLLIPSALGFDALVGHSTLPPPPGADAPELSGRLWNETYPYIDGAWVEGWVRPYWTDAPLPETEWRRQIEAADRAALIGQVFIAASAYSNNDELEYALSSFLLITHHQGRLVFQPMPLVRGQRPDAGYSLEIMQREVRDKSHFFDVPLGAPRQMRHLVPTSTGNVWRRAFDNGVVYVNSTDDRTMTIQLGAKMRRMDGSETNQIVLGPHSGVTLTYE